VTGPLAGKAFLRHRRAGGTSTNVLADFSVGAHAVMPGCGIATRDVRRHRNCFPTVSLVTPVPG
jgi:predicted nucleic acid-binding protein